ncbi:unnamed protein product [[Candida] boidinii]|nr:hypothetical protein BVG19_g40 [[Candida] boidinii]OWB53392.1 hydrolase activity protein [[Candida] boidinii]GME86702.1 unnamed protein product [[Candida] boidinii]
MDDDGLMINFAVDEPSSASSNRKSKKQSVKVTGGKWKDRRNTKLSLEGRGRGGGSGASKGKVQGPNSIALSKERSFDKSKSNHDTRDNDSKPPFKSNKRKFESTSTSDKDNNTEEDDNDHTTANKVRHIHETSGENGGKNNTYVSSLFTANPEIQKRNYEDENKIESLKPSNAPLADDTTFAGLGINELLTKHLTEFLRYQNPTKIQRMVIPKLLNSNTNDLFVQAQTGSGKTLAFALPIFQKLTEIKDLTRTSGLFAIILTPTRELATQIYSVLETLSRCCHRIVPGIVIGGEKKKSEKARLRKGVNILVATPGRLVDHIENTTNLELSDIRYVVMDEGDRLMELGFEESINKILNEISKSTRISTTTRIFPTLPRKRINILCSATIKGTVKKLGEVSLENAELISLKNSPSSGVVSFDENTKDSNGETVKAPDQLIQQILIVPPKLRLVTLAGLLKNITKGTNYSTTIVFFSCADSVDFHFITLTRKGKRIVVKKEKAIADIEKIEETEAEAETDSKNDKGNKKRQDGNKRNFKSRDNNNNNKKENRDSTDEEKSLEDQSITALTAPLINEDTIIYKLHGSLSQQVRTSTLNHFANSSKDKHTVLLCTDVASRGLDLPEISRVIEYDPPFTVEDHLHRIGRTARAGKEGTASLFLLPGDEEKYVEKIEPLHDNGIHFTNFEKVLKNAFDKKVTTEEEEANKSKNRLKNIGKWDVEATTWQLDAERSLLDQPRANEIATNAFISHIRAYTTHLSSERDCFNVKKLHLGHLAKAFALRETPKKLAANNTNSESKKPKETAKTKMYRIADMAFKAQSDEFNIS